MSSPGNTHNGSRDLACHMCIMSYHECDMRGLSRDWNALGIFSGCCDDNMMRNDISSPTIAEISTYCFCSDYVNLHTEICRADAI